MKMIMRLLLAAMLMISAAAAYLIRDNNRPVASPSRAELLDHLASSIRWLEANRDSLLRQDNTMLWWMLDRSASLSGDPVLTRLVAEFKQPFIRQNPSSVWTRLFNPYSPARVPFVIPDDWNYYHPYFAYGLTCDQELGREKIVIDQGRPGYCLRFRPISPACVTHQLMGARFVQQNQCDDPQKISALIASLQDTIVTQLTYDPRAVDVYIQRVLMLVESGAGARVKPIWLRRVLDAQLDDGGWGDAQPLLSMGGSRYLGFRRNGFGLYTPASDFHATAQGVLLLTLLTSEQHH